MCLVAHNGNLDDFPLLQAKLLKAGLELELGVFCFDSYFGIKEIFINNMNNLLVKEAKPPYSKNLDKNTDEKEMQYV